MKTIMKRKLLSVLLILTIGQIVAYDVAQFNRTYVDPSRDNRQIPTVIFHPVLSSEIRDNLDPDFPVIVFGHGWILPYTTYLDLANHFAALGWIVAFPTTEGSLFPSHLNFALDLAFVVQGVIGENSDPTSVLYGQVDPFAVHMGHSMGGGASVLAAEDTAAKAMVTLAAANTNPSAINAAQGVIIPSLTLAGAADTITPPAQHQIPIYNNLASAYKSYVSFNGVDHFNIYTNDLIFDVISAWLAYVRSGDTQDLDIYYGLLEQYQTSGDLSFEHWGYPARVQDYTVGIAPQARVFIYPNPVKDTATLAYELNTVSSVTIEIYNLRGQKISTHHQDSMIKGMYHMRLDRVFIEWQSWSSGAYLIRLVLDESQAFSLFTLIK